MWWAQVLIGWPAILGSLLLSGIGIGLLRPGWLFAGAVSIMGFGWFYLAESPNTFFKLLGYSLPLFHFSAAIAVHKRLRWVAAIFLFPHVAVAAYFGLKVLNQ